MRVASLPCSRNRDATPRPASSDQVAGGAPHPVQVGRYQNVAGWPREVLAQRVLVHWPRRISGDVASIRVRQRVRLLPHLKRELWATRPEQPE
jgi:hypothetical protein